MKNPYLNIDQKIVGDIYTSSEVMDNLSILCDDFGSRFGGTEGERLAAEFIMDKFKQYGLKNVHFEPIEYLGWIRGDARLEIIEPIHKEIPCISLPQSPAVEMEGKIVDLGDGHPDDFEKRAAEIKGNIVMVSSEIHPKGITRWVHRGEKFDRSLLAGASGFIFVNHYPGYGPATGGVGVKEKGAPIPGISINKENGAYIQRLAKRRGQVKIRISSTDKLTPMESWNVIGDLPGKDHPEEIVLMGCHYDGHDISQGAGDPASGVTAVMEAARVLSKYARELHRTIRFAMWGVEEIGLFGSKAYVKKHLDELKNLRFYLNLDAAGSVDPKDINLHAWPELQDTFENYRDEMSLDFKIGQKFHSFSDHYPFLLKGVVTGGIESVRESRTGRGYGHTYYDTVDKVTTTGMRDAAAMASRIALRVANEEKWPVSHRGKDEIGQLLSKPPHSEAQDYQEKLDKFLEKR